MIVRACTSAARKQFFPERRQGIGALLGYKIDTPALYFFLSSKKQSPGKIFDIAGIDVPLASCQI